MSSTEIATNGGASVSPAKTITLKTADDKLFHVDESIAMEFTTVKTYFADNDNRAGTAFPLPNVSSAYLTLILEYVEKQLKLRAESAPLDQKKKEDEEFVKKLSDVELKELLVAVNYLDIKSFLDMLCQSAAERIKNFGVKKARAFFGIVNDYTDEEETRVRNENDWAFEGAEIEN